MASGTISYTTSPVHTTAKFVEMVKELKQMGVSSICIKDMAGIMGPKEAYDLVSAIKDAVNLPIDLHTHSTTGLAFMTYLKAVEAGVDIIDTAISPFSGGTSQPATETLYCALKELGYGVDLNHFFLHDNIDFSRTAALGGYAQINFRAATDCTAYVCRAVGLSPFDESHEQRNKQRRRDAGAHPDEQSPPPIHEINAGVAHPRKNTQKRHYASYAEQLHAESAQVALSYVAASVEIGVSVKIRAAYKVAIGSLEAVGAGAYKHKYNLDNHNQSCGAGDDKKHLLQR